MACKYGSGHSAPEIQNHRIDYMKFISDLEVKDTTKDDILRRFFLH